MTPFDFDQLRDVTRRASETMRPRGIEASEPARFDRERSHAPLEDHEVDALLDELRSVQDCRVRTERPSHRRVVGRFISFSKRVIFRVLRPFMHEAFETQARFNETTFELLLRLDEDRRQMRAEIARLRGGAPRA